MLKKLFKYDWKSVSLLLFILHGILLFYTLIGRIGISIAMSQSASHVITEDSAQVFGIVGMLYVLGFVLFIFAIMIATFVYLAARMQKSLFSDEGYLTHTHCPYLRENCFFLKSWFSVPGPCWIFCASLFPF